jgi:hypothetical protein
MDGGHTAQYVSLIAPYTLFARGAIATLKKKENVQR